MADRVQCTQCSNMILEQRASDNDGLCAPCFKKKNPKTGKDNKSSPLSYELLLRTPANRLTVQVLQGLIPKHLIHALAVFTLCVVGFLIPGRRQNCFD